MKVHDRYTQYAYKVLISLLYLIMIVGFCSKLRSISHIYIYVRVCVVRLDTPSTLLLLVFRTSNNVPITSIRTDDTTAIGTASHAQV